MHIEILHHVMCHPSLYQPRRLLFNISDPLGSGQMMRINMYIHKYNAITLLSQSILGRPQIRNRQTIDLSHTRTFVIKLAKPLYPPNFSQYLNNKINKFSMTRHNPVTHVLKNSQTKQKYKRKTK